jgi:hypothetical protein
MIFISCLLVSHSIMTTHPDWDWAPPAPWHIVGMEYGGNRGNNMHKFFSAEEGTPIPRQCDRLVVEQKSGPPEAE